MLLHLSLAQKRKMVKVLLVARKIFLYKTRKIIGIAMLDETLVRKVTYAPVPQRGIFLLAGDIGGTNSNFGIVSLDGEQITLHTSFHYPSQRVTDFAELVAYVVQNVEKHYSITVHQGCLGVAGVVSPESRYIKPTNLPTAIDADAIIARTSLERLLLVNDFQAIVYGIDKIAPQDLIMINNGTPVASATKACIGAGTGLGKVIMVWDKNTQRYTAVPSEGGHADGAAHNETDYAFMKFLQQHRTAFAPVSWEHMLSGDGIKDIYRFLGTQQKYRETPFTQEIAQAGFAPDKISYYGQRDPRSYDTFNYYIRLYARCAKNFSLDTLARSGMYIAGGIAAKNVAMFMRPDFMQEFTRSDKMRTLLEQIPIFVIADYNVSLFGAAEYARLILQGIIV